ncbi:MAG TPA: hypothetical protein VFN38_15220 [Gemmatimonadaceae bacterium]|nr:hypothetical protein [Gemmatimonadaceae bacterium]
MAIVLATSCSGSGKMPETALMRPKKPTQAEVIALARSYTFVGPTIPVTALAPIPNAGVKDVDAPSAITIARAVATVSPAPWPEKLLALIHSDKEYKPLGIEAGDNYIWRNEDGSDPKQWETYIVPAAAGANVRKFKRSGAEYSSGDHTQPRLVVQVTRSVVTFGACLEDPACGTGHCGYGEVQ